MFKYIRVTALITGLLLLAAQSVTLIHAADHPFHASDEICVVFASFEHNDHAIAVLPYNSELTPFENENTFCCTQIITHTSPLSHQSRAPPLHS